MRAKLLEALLAQLKRPYSLDIQTGARFTVTLSPGATEEEAEGMISRGMDSLAGLIKTGAEAVMGWLAEERADRERLANLEAEARREARQAREDAQRHD